MVMKSHEAESAHQDSGEHDHQQTAGGDSGGPVFTLDGEGVRIKGIVNAGLHDDPRYIFYQDWPTISTQFGLSGVVTR
jgi:hypothetical protein